MPDYVTLADVSAVARAEGDFLKAGVVDTLRMEASILDMLPFAPASSLKAHGLRIKTLPEVQNRKVNANYSHKVGTTEPLEETGFLFGTSIAIDRLYDKVSPTLITGDYGAFQVDLFMKALARQYSFDFLHNTPAINEDSIVGLWSRLQDEFSGQQFSAGGVDVSPDGATLSASFNQLYDYIEDLIYACDGHTCDALLMNDTMLKRIRSGLRQLGILKTTEDSFARKITTWGEGGPKLIDIGYKGDQTTRIIGNAESTTGAPSGGTLTSIYAVKFGLDYLTGWQLEEPQVIDHQKAALQREVVVDWYTGLFITNPRSIARLYRIQAA